MPGHIVTYLRAIPPPDFLKYRRPFNRSLNEMNTAYYERTIVKVHEIISKIVRFFLLLSSIPPFVKWNVKERILAKYTAVQFTIRFRSVPFR